MLWKVFLTHSREQSKSYLTSRSESYKNAHEKGCCEWKITIWVIFSFLFFFVCLFVWISKLAGQKGWRDLKQIQMISSSSSFTRWNRRGAVRPHALRFMYMNLCTAAPKPFICQTQSNLASVFISPCPMMKSLSHAHTHTLFPSVKVQSKAVQLLRLCSVCARYNPDIAHPRSLKYDCTAVLP